ncbi:MAG: acyltransferase family protein [Actinomycetota bacterium]
MHDQPIGNRNYALESCRGLAATMVVAYHVAKYTSWPVRFTPRLLISNGDAGVTLFFVLSGFLLWRPFADSIWKRERTWDTKRFLVNRTLRIVPTYWVALTIVLATGGFASASIGQYLLLQNYRRSTLFSGISPAWTLSLEVAFYLLLPIVGAIGLALAKRTRNLAAVQYGILIAWAGSSVLFKIVSYSVWRRPASDSFIYFSFPSKMNLFAFGMLLAVWHARRASATSARRPWLSWLAPVTGALIIAAAVSSRYSSNLSAIWFDTVCGVGFTLLIHPLIFPNRSKMGVIRKTLEWKPLVWLGTISYSLYLWHHPLISWMAKVHLLRSSLSMVPLNLIVAFVASVFVAFVSYRLVEYPFLRMRRTWTRKAEVQRAERAEAIAVP